MAFSDILISKYVRAHAIDPTLTKGRFMREAYPDKYKDDNSARRAFNKIAGRETSGRRLEYEANPEIHRAEVYGKTHKRREGFVAGGRRGLWKVNVKFTYLDQDGNPYSEERSFIMDSSEYDSMLDVPYLEEIIPDIVDQHIEYWRENDSMDGNYISIETEIIPIRRFDTRHVVDLDELEIE